MNRRIAKKRRNRQADVAVRALRRYWNRSKRINRRVRRLLAATRRAGVAVEVVDVPPWASVAVYGRWVADTYGTPWRITPWQDHPIGRMKRRPSKEPSP